jgi:nucleolin
VEEAPKKEKKSKKAEPEPEEEEEEEPPMKMKSGKSGAAGASATKSAAPSAEATCEVFMGNLSFQIDEASLQEAFKSCGTISSCKWLEDRETGKFKGCGFITFASPEDAAKAVAMNGTEVLGRAIKCDFSQGKKPSAGGAGGKFEPKPQSAKPAGCTTLFCGNLSFDIDDDKMKAFFKDCGEVSSIRWLTDKESGQFKGCGFVEFSDPDSSLDKAAKLNGKDCCGRAIRIDFSAPRAPKQAW